LKISYLIDTDWVVHNLNGVRKVRTKLLELEPYGLGLSIICWLNYTKEYIIHKTPKLVCSG